MRRLTRDGRQLAPFAAEWDQHGIFPKDTIRRAGELGFFPPYSWWPLWAAATLGVMVFGLAMAAWWLFIIGGVLGALATCGLVFEYYRGEHAH